jgi:hypothetical protein
MSAVLLVLPDAAFDIAGRGTVFLTGISADKECPVKPHEEILLQTPSGHTFHAIVQAVEFVLLKASKEQFGILIAQCEAQTSQLVAGTKVYRVTTSLTPATSTSE